MALEPFAGNVLFFPHLSGDPIFRLLCHISLLRLFAGHPSLISILRTDDTASASLPSPHSLVADASISATSPLVVVVKYVFCGFLFFFSSYAPAENPQLPTDTPQLPTDTPVRVFPIVWKLFLLHDSLPGTGLHL